MNRQLARQAKIDEIATLLVPVTDKQLILPNVAVAEILPWREPEPIADAPAWLLGMLDWRKQQVPLVSFEAINAEPPAVPQAGRRIAILNNVTGDPALPFCGIVTAGVPRLLRVLADEMGMDADALPGPAERARVMAAGERASIPDLAFIESQVAQELRALLQQTL